MFMYADLDQTKVREVQPFFREDGRVVGAEVVKKIREGFIVRDPNTGIEVRLTNDKINEILHRMSVT